MQYKTVLGPLGMKITKNDSYDEAMKEYAAILNREAVGGWRLVQIQELCMMKKYYIKCIINGTYMNSM